MKTFQPLIMTVSQHLDDLVLEKTDKCVVWGELKEKFVQINRFPYRPIKSWWFLTYILMLKRMCGLGISSCVCLFVCLSLIYLTTCDIWRILIGIKFRLLQAVLRTYYGFLSRKNNQDTENL